MRETTEKPVEIGAGALVNRNNAEQEVKLHAAIEAIADYAEQAEDGKVALSGDTVTEVVRQLRDLADALEEVWPPEETDGQTE